MKLGGFVFTAIILFSSGCICCGDFSGLSSTTTQPSSGGPYCSAPYIQVGGDCCLDQNRNSVCDSDEIIQPPQTDGLGAGEPTSTTLQTDCMLDSDCVPCGSTCLLSTEAEAVRCASPTVACRCISGDCVPEAVTTTTLTSTTSTTISNEPNCFDGVKNQDEEYVDCDGACSSECIVTTLGGWQEFLDYKFRLRKAEVTDSGGAKYYVNIRTPDGKEDERMVTTGESLVDHLRLKVMDYGEQNPRFYIKINKEDLQKVYAISSDAVLYTVGGDTCQEGILWRKSVDGDLCTRKYGAYNITGSRAENGVQLVIIKDDGSYTATPITLKDKQTTTFDDIVIGAIADREHYIVGGYTLIYVHYK